MLPSCPVVSVTLQRRHSPRPSPQSSRGSPRQYATSTPSYVRRRVNSMVEVATPATTGPISTLSWSTKHEGGAVMARASDTPRVPPSYPRPLVTTRCKSAGPVDTREVTDRLYKPVPRPERVSLPTAAAAPAYLRRNVEGIVAVPTAATVGMIETLEWSKKYECAGPVPRAHFERQLSSCTMHQSRGIPQGSVRTNNKNPPPPLGNALESVRKVKLDPRDAHGLGCFTSRVPTARFWQPDEPRGVQAANERRRNAHLPSRCGMPQVDRFFPSTSSS